MAKKIFNSLWFWELLCFAAAWAGSAAMGPASMAWYRTLVKSPLTPPGYVFPIVWTLLYLLMGAAARLAVGRGPWKTALPFVIQLLLNVLWTWFFFYLQMPAMALLDFVLLLAALLWTIYEFYKVETLPALLLSPYLAWGVFAFHLNLYVVFHN